MLFENKNKRKLHRQDKNNGINNQLKSVCFFVFFKWVWFVADISATNQPIAKRLYWISKGLTYITQSRPAHSAAQLHLRGKQSAIGSAACASDQPCQTRLVLMARVCCGDQLCVPVCAVRKRPVAYFPPSLMQFGHCYGALVRFSLATEAQRPANMYVYYRLIREHCSIYMSYF